MVRPPAAPHCPLRTTAPGPGSKQQTQGGRWSQLEDTNHPRPHAEPFRRWPAVREACQQPAGRQERQPSPSGGWGPAAPARRPACGPGPSQRPTRLPSGRPAGDFPGLRRSRCGSGEVRRGRTAGLGKLAKLPPGGTAHTPVCAGPPPKLLSCQVSAHGGTLATPPGHPGPRLSGGGTGGWGGGQGSACGPGPALPQRWPSDR